MPTSAQIVEDARTRYRHTYLDGVVYGWLDAVHKQVWKKVKRDAVPHTILLDKTGSYELPIGVNRADIKSVTIGIAGGKFTPLDYKQTSENGSDSVNEYFLSDNFIILQEPTDELNQYMLLMYYDKSVPTTISVDNQNEVPELHESYHELLTYGLLERIAGARKDVKMKNNYANDYHLLLMDFIGEATDQDPDYPSCRDELPRRSRYGCSVDD